ncbi:MAG: PilW family protein [bacterium]
MKGDKKMSAGYSLIELLLAIAITFFVFTGLFFFFTSQHRTSDVQAHINEMNQNIRVAMNRISSELRMAGYKTGGFSSDFMQNLSHWIPSSSNLLPSDPYSVTMDDSIVITPGNPGDPDMLTFIYGDSTPAQLDANAFADDEANPSLILRYDPNNGYTGTQHFNVGEIIYIGYGSFEGLSLEFAMIKAVDNSSNTLIIDTDPIDSDNNDLSDIGGKIGPYTPKFRVGTDVGKINVVSYMVFNEANDPFHLYHRAGHPCLKRKSKIGDDSGATLVEDIEFFEIYIDDDTYIISLRAKTSKQDKTYIDPTYGDHYRRRNLESQVFIRN